MSTSGKVEKEIELRLKKVIIGDEAFSGEESQSKHVVGDEKKPKSSDMCGLGPWHPQWMQIFARPIFFTINYISLDIIQGLLYAYLIGAASTLEKRFLYSSKVTGAILIADNIGLIILSPVFGYLAKHINRSRLIAIGMLFEYFACFVIISPYFIYGPASIADVNSALVGRKSNSSVQLCNGINDETCLDSTSLTIWPAVYLIWTANFMNGVSYSVFYTVGLPHIDDNVSKKQAPMYFAGIDVVQLIGPAFGYMISSYCLSLPEDVFWSSKGPQVSPSDPKFIGAWWLGFIIISFIVLLPSLSMFLFPKDFHQKSDQKFAIDHEDHSKETEGESSSLKDKLAGPKKSLVRLFTNPVWMLDNLAAIFRYLGLGGLFVFMPKYIESQFHKTASDASFWNGMFQTIAMGIGISLGGLFLTCYKPRARILTSLILLVELVANMATISGLFMGCPKSEFFSIDRNLLHSCNINCQCSRQNYEPFCSSNGHTNYFSPCFAGCQRMVGDDAATLCFCEGSQGYHPFAKVIKGHCDSDCNNFALYMSVTAMGQLIACSANIANLIVKFRSVQPQDKAFATGLRLTFMGLFAWVPYPIVFGAITDATCAIWQETCGQTGNCWIYDQDKFRVYLHTSAFAFMMMGTVLDAFLIYFSKRMTNLYDDG